ncbi:MAG: tRNA (adenosine(37)-N6)-threonylcarbamoyltransferase complex transferase subunit TsaD [Bacteroidota bacterium]|nr:tRNA (adenosine(37)-N6)-threonylcarbamoyltransferase complex transferase subunit TsaD [Bacteroidota bacterium]
MILGIESSCDETSAAILRGRDIASVIISSQHFHTSFGGVVPELASRAHIRSIVPIAEEALAKACISARDITAIAVTFAPGLMGALLVGLNFAKGMALSLSVPLIGVHHIEAHIFSAMLEEEKPELPFLALVVSGGHTLLVGVEDIGRYSVIGKTLDDAAGEAFDKVGKMLGMGYPAGPVIDRAAKSGDPTFVKFPRSMMNDETFDFSFSGIKTSVLYYLRDNPGILSTRSADIAASFQQAVVDVLVGKTIRAARERNIRDIVCVGGVSANSLLRSQFKTTCDEQKKRFFSPRPMLSTDNAAMIAMLGALKLDRGISSDLSLSAMARVPL